MMTSVTVFIIELDYIFTGMLKAAQMTAKARELNTGRATRPCTSGAGCHFDTDNHAPKERVHYVF